MKKVKKEKRLNFADVKKVIAKHLKTAFGVEKFEITYAKLEEDGWKVNVEFAEEIELDERGLTATTTTALFAIDVISGEVKEFKKGYEWRY